MRPCDRGCGLVLVPLARLKTKKSSVTEIDGLRAEGIDFSRSNVQRNSLSKTGPGRCSRRGAAAEKEFATQHIARLVDRDIGSGHVSIPDEKRGCRQSAEAATDDMRLHLPHGPRQFRKASQTSPSSTPPGSRNDRPDAYPYNASSKGLDPGRAKPGMKIMVT